VIIFGSRPILHRRCAPRGPATSCNVPPPVFGHVPVGGGADRDEALRWLLPRPRTRPLPRSPFLRSKRSAVACVRQAMRLKSDPIIAMRRIYRCADPVAVQRSTRNCPCLPTSQPTLRLFRRVPKLRHEAVAASLRHHLGGRPSSLECAGRLGRPRTCGGYP
jgi:hypothetical protein